ncbi:MAG: SulP family inorganic anion transporter [Actinobacteria bacterium]|nr:SulP family inorganic anion transporter [Actinomycetota bacterium]MBI3686299.1 SulP family inorganic anion transporter [Actinomycetota bacterium]
MAGIAVALVLIPQSLAYSELAGLPALHGLYVAAVAPIAAAFIGSSPYLQTGPVAMTSLLTLGALTPFATQGSATYVGLAALLAVFVGISRLAMGIFRVGSIAYLMSQPVVAAFTVAASLLIVASQVPTLLGVRGEGANPLLSAVSALIHPQHWNAVALAFGVGALALILLGRRLGPRVPVVLLVSIAALVVSVLIDFTGPQVGHLASGTPPLTPSLPWSMSSTLIVPAIIIAVVGFAEPSSIARRYAAAERTHWDPDREMIGQGLANTASGLFSGYPSGGSFSRSALNKLSGATSRWSGGITGVAVLLIVATPVIGTLSRLPKSVLAGLVIAAVLSLIEVSPFTRLWRASKAQFVVAITTFLGSLLLAPRVERAVVLGVAVSFIVHLWRELRLHIVHEIDGTTLHVHPSGVLYFASAPLLERRINEILADHPQADRVVLHLGGLGRIDITGILVLRSLADHAVEENFTLELADVSPGAARLVARVLPELATEVTDSVPDNAAG